MVEIVENTLKGHVVLTEVGRFEVFVVGAHRAALVGKAGGALIDGLEFLGVFAVAAVKDDDDGAAEDDKDDAGGKKFDNGWR